jgi:hypothetical protein
LRQYTLAFKPQELLKAAVRVRPTDTKLAEMLAAGKTRRF